MKQIRTDLAMEDATGLDRAHMPGVHISEWETGGVTMTEVRVESEEGARLIGKPMGVYITMECPRVKKRDVDARRAVSALLGEEQTQLFLDYALHGYTAKDLAKRCGVSPECIWLRISRLRRRIAQHPEIFYLVTVLLSGFPFTQA